MKASMVRCKIPACRGGMLVISASLIRGEISHMVADLGKSFAAQASIGERKVRCEAVFGEETYPAGWQAWRIGVEPLASPAAVELRVTTVIQPEVDIVWKAHLVPGPDAN